MTDKAADKKLEGLENDNAVLKKKLADANAAAEAATGVEADLRKTLADAADKVEILERKLKSTALPSAKDLSGPKALYQLVKPFWDNRILQPAGAKLYFAEGKQPSGSTLVKVKTPVKEPDTQSE